MHCSPKRTVAFAKNCIFFAKIFGQFSWNRHFRFNPRCKTMGGRQLLLSATLCLLNKDDICNYSHIECKIDIELFLTESEQFTLTSLRQMIEFASGWLEDTLQCREACRDSNNFNWLASSLVLSLTRN